MAYALWTLVVLSVYFLYDTPRPYRNDPEMAAMREIQASPLDTVLLTGRPTSIVSWAGPTSPEESETAGRLLHLWNVTDREKRFYFPQE